MRPRLGYHVPKPHVYFYHGKWHVSAPLKANGAWIFKAMKYRDQLNYGY